MGPGGHQAGFVVEVYRVSEERKRVGPRGMQAAAHTGIVSERLPFNCHFTFWEEKQARK